MTAVSYSYAQEALPDGTLIRPAGYANVFIIQKGKKHPIQNIEVFNSYGYKWEEVKVLDQSVEHAYSLALLIRLKDDPKVYFLANGKGFWIRTPQTFISAGYASVDKDVIEINKFEMGTYQDLRFVKWDTSRPSTDYPGAYIEGEKTVYLLSPFGTKRAIQSPAIFETYTRNWNEIRTIPEELVDALPDTVLVRAKGGCKVYKLEDGKKRWIVDGNVFVKDGFSFDEVEEISSLDMEAYPEGDAIR